MHVKWDTRNGACTIEDAWTIKDFLWRVEKNFGSSCGWPPSFRLLHVRHGGSKRGRQCWGRHSSLRVKKISTTQKSLPKSVTQFRWSYGGTSQALIHSCDSTKLLVALRCSRLPLLLTTSKLDQIVSQVNKSRHYYTDKFAQLRQSPKLLPGLWLSRDFIVAERMATLVKYDIVERTNGLSLSASKCKPVAADMTNVSPRQFCRCNSLPKYRLRFVNSFSIHEKLCIIVQMIKWSYQYYFFNLYRASISMTHGISVRPSTPSVSPVLVFVFKWLFM